jgi:hypothetical protein
MWLLLDRANVVPSLPILVSLMMKGLSSSETSVLTRATWRNIPEEATFLYLTQCSRDGTLVLCAGKKPTWLDRIN